MFKRTLQVLVGVALAVQLTGCFFSDNDHRGHYYHPDHHDSGIDVHVHG
jgi:hypothetical protein